MHATARRGDLTCVLKVVLECEETNKAALSLYHTLGFVRDKRLHKYYLNGSDAFRLKLWISEKSTDQPPSPYSC